MNRLTLLLLLSFTSTFAQTKSFSTYTFTLGYGIQNIERQIVKNNIDQDHSSYPESIFNRKQPQVGPIYLKAETNLSKNVGLALCLNYSQFSFSGNYYAYKVYETNGDYYSYYLGGSNPVGRNYESFLATEKLKYSSLAIAIRSNFYLYNKPKFKLYLGIGLGYRINNKKHESNINEFVKSDYKTHLFRETIFPSPVAGELTFGVRGNVWKNYGLYAEVGLAKSLFQTGVFYVFNRKTVDEVK